MKVATALAVATLCSGVPIPSFAEPSDAAPGGCVVVSALARFDVGGFDHWVSVVNGCAIPVRCAVWTDVNPVPQTIDLVPEQSAEVLTFRASSARVFTPSVTCEHLP